MISVEKRRKIVMARKNVYLNTTLRSEFSDPDLFPGP